RHRPARNRLSYSLSPLFRDPGDRYHHYRSFWPTSEKRGDPVRRTGSLLTSFLIGLGGLIALPVLAAGSARADTVTPLTQLANFHQVVVDSADGYVFLSEGVSSGSWFNGTFDANAIVVTDLSGNYVATLD